MHASTVFALALAGIAAAQSTTGVSAPSASGVSGCGTQIDDIINACMATEQSQLSTCSANDWSCLCSGWTNVVTCYNNCPSDPNAFSAKQTETSYCNAAKAYPSSTTAMSSAMASTSAMGSGSSAATSAMGSSGSSTATGSSSGASSTSSASAAMAPYVAPAGGALAALFGLVALL